MEDMGNYGYTLFRTIPCFFEKQLSAPRISIIFRKNA